MIQGGIGAFMIRFSAMALQCVAKVRKAMEAVRARGRTRVQLHMKPESLLPMFEAPRSHDVHGSDVPCVFLSRLLRRDSLLPELISRLSEGFFAQTDFGDVGS